MKQAYLANVGMAFKNRNPVANTGQSNCTRKSSNPASYDQEVNGQPGCLGCRN